MKKLIRIFLLFCMIAFILLVMFGFYYNMYKSFYEGEQGIDYCHSINYDGAKFPNYDMAYFKCCRDIVHDSGIGIKEECTGLLYVYDLDIENYQKNKSMLDFIITI